MSNNSLAYQGTHDSTDRVHDYERKAPLGDWEIRRMLRVQPSKPVNQNRDYIPEDALDLIVALNRGKVAIIPTCDLPETYYHMSHHTDGKSLRIKVSDSQDKGWSRVELDDESGRLAREIFREDFPALFN